jgi:phospholipase C
MKGFVQSYEESSPGHGRKVMRCFDPRMVPVISTLAREFAVCTRWHCSLPGETWPNREFAHSGTSRGRAENLKSSLWSNAKTIFEQLDEAGATWRIYHDDTPHTWAYASLWDTPEKRGRFKPIRKLYEDIASGQLASYTFVEPDYGVVGAGNSQHPGQAHSRQEFVAGERLIHNIYDALRRSPAVFEKTVFVITYDEHGGFYDHVPPPKTVKPDGMVWRGTFAFDLLGVRVPTVIVSPWIPRHTVDETLYDHTAIIQTVRSVFAPGKPALTQRDKQANVSGTCCKRTAIHVVAMTCRPPRRSPMRRPRRSKRSSWVASRASRCCLRPRSL